MFHAHLFSVFVWSVVHMHRAGQAASQYCVVPAVGSIPHRVAYSSDLVPNSELVQYSSDVLSVLSTFPDCFDLVIRESLILCSCLVIHASLWNVSYCMWVIVTLAWNLDECTHLDHECDLAWFVEAYCVYLHGCIISVSLGSWLLHSKCFLWMVCLHRINSLPVAIVHLFSQTEHFRVLLFAQVRVRAVVLCSDGDALSAMVFVSHVSWLLFFHLTLCHFSKIWHAVW